MGASTHLAAGGRRCITGCCRYRDPMARREDPAGRAHPPVILRDRRFLRVVQHSDIERIRLTDFGDAKAELAKVHSLDGSSMRPLIKYVLDRAVAPRIANRGVPIGAGDITWPDRGDERLSA